MILSLSVNCVYIYIYVKIQFHYTITSIFLCSYPTFTVYFVSTNKGSSGDFWADRNNTIKMRGITRHHATRWDTTRLDSTRLDTMKQRKCEKEENVFATVFCKKTIFNFLSMRGREKNIVWRFLRETGSWLIYSRWIFCDVPACRNDVANYLLCRKVGPI